MEHRVRKVIALAEESLHKGWSPAKLAALHARRTQKWYGRRVAEHGAVSV